MFPYLTDEQEKLRSEVTNFVENKVKPVAFELDEKCKFPVELFREIGERGWFKFNVPEKYGGLGKNTTNLFIVFSEIAKGLASLSVSLDTQYLLMEALNLYGSDYLKEKYIPPLVKGEIIAAFALTEKTAGSDIGGITGTAKKDGNEYILNGEKCIVVSGAVADIYLVFLKTDPTKGVKGLSAFIVERNMDGVSVEPLNPSGLRACGLGKLVLNDVRIPVENLLGSEGEGAKIALSVLDFGRIGIASTAYGIAQAAFEAAVEYAKERKQFNAPISSFQGLRWMLAELAVEIEAARLLILEAAAMRDKGLRYTKETAMAKLYSSKVAVKAALTAIQVFGHYGYLKDKPLERYLRDAKGLEIAEGTSEIQKLVIARQIFS
ncbi:MAG: acyl-CoA dehydrogenase family protein [Candidatus Baldrarchaeota archaeon]